MMSAERRRRTTTPVVVVSSRTGRGWRALHSFFWGGILRARALYSTRIFGETFLCGKTNVIKGVEKHFSKKPCKGSKKVSKRVLVILKGGLKK